MKKITVLLAIMGLFATTNIHAQKEMNEGGFFLNVGSFSPNLIYLTPKSFDLNIKELKDAGAEGYDMGINIEVGNLFTLAKMDDNALQLRATWFDGNYSVTTFDDTIKYNLVQGSILKIGPDFTYALNESMAIDVFYQIGPVFAGSIYEIPATEVETYSIGMLNTLGLSYRFKIFTAGINMNFGSAKDTDSEDYEQMGMDKNDYTYRIGSFRFFLGFKF